MNLSRLMDDVPSGPTASSANLFHSIAFSLIFAPFSPSISSFTSFPTSSLLTFLSISMPTPHSLQLYLQFIGWSPKKGQHSIGTPALKLSMVEPQPQWVRNPPTDGWLSTSSCGHQLAMKPCFWVFSANSAGKTDDSPLTKSGLIINKNGILLLASPIANSTSWSVAITTVLP